MSIGSTLKEQRERLGLSIEDIKNATKMSAATILAIDGDDFSNAFLFSAPIYARGFIRLYARALHLDPDPLTAEYTARYVAGGDGRASAAPPVALEAATPDSGKFQALEPVAPEFHPVETASAMPVKRVASNVPADRPPEPKAPTPVPASDPVKDALLFPSGPVRKEVPPTESVAFRLDAGGAEPSEPEPLTTDDEPFVFRPSAGYIGTREFSASASSASNATSADGEALFAETPAPTPVDANATPANGESLFTDDPAPVPAAANAAPADDEALFTAAPAPDPAKTDADDTAEASPVFCPAYRIKQGSFRFSRTMIVAAVGVLLAALVTVLVISGGSSGSDEQTDEPPSTTLEADLGDEPAPAAVPLPPLPPIRSFAS